VCRLLSAMPVGVPGCPRRRDVGARPHLPLGRDGADARRADRLHGVRPAHPRDPPGRLDGRQALPPLLRSAGGEQDRGGAARWHEPLHHRRGAGQAHLAARPLGRLAGRQPAAPRHPARARRRQSRVPARRARRAVRAHGAGGGDAAVRALVPALLVALGGCGGDRARSPSCGLAQMVGPTLIQQQLTKAPYVITDAPRGLPPSLPARVAATPPQGEVLVARRGDAREPVSRVVAVTARRRSDAGRERVVLNSAYVRALAAAGLVPAIVPPQLAPPAAGPLLDAAAGLVLTGGEDVDPACYGAVPHPRLGETDPGRDAMALPLI